MALKTTTAIKGLIKLQLTPIRKGLAAMIRMYSLEFSRQ